MTPQQAYNELVKTGKPEIEDPDDATVSWAFEEMTGLLQRLFGISWPKSGETFAQFKNPAIRAPEEHDGKQRLAE